MSFIKLFSKIMLSFLEFRDVLIMIQFIFRFMLWPPTFPWSLCWIYPFIQWIISPYYLNLLVLFLDFTHLFKAVPSSLLFFPVSVQKNIFLYLIFASLHLLDIFTLGLITDIAVRFTSIFITNLSTILC